MDNLQASEARFAGIVGAALDAIIGIDAQERVVVFNPAAERLFGYQAAEVIGQPLDRFIPAASRSRHHGQIADFGHSGKTNRAMGAPGPVSGVHADGRLIPLEASIARMMIDGQPFYVAILRDISERLAVEQALRIARDDLEARVTERTAALAAANESLERQADELRATEARLRASLHEKEVLLKEVHHRVKNNLQVVVSLLRLQGRQVRDATAAATLRESRRRVEVIAFVHELLYRADDLAAIDAVTYLHQLGTQLLRLYGDSPGRVTLAVDAEAHMLSLDQAIFCGLIISELLANSLKYAFSADQHGTIGIALYATALDMLTLRVWDTGRGFPVDSADNRPASLGLTLVHDLTRQLRGTVAIESTAGVTVTLTFPR